MNHVPWQDADKKDATKKDLRLHHHPPSVDAFPRYHSPCLAASIGLPFFATTSARRTKDVRRALFCYTQSRVMPKQYV